MHQYEGRHTDIAPQRTRAGVTIVAILTVGINDTTPHDSG